MKTVELTYSKGYATQMTFNSVTYEADIILAQEFQKYRYNK